MTDSWLAYRVEELELGAQGCWQAQSDAQLPEGDVLIEVHYSSLNYKDALSASGNKGVTRHYPHTPGIDAAGVVISDRSGEYQAGDEVVLFGYDLGMNTCGGYGQRIRVPAAWVLHKPVMLTLAQSMRWGTAGFTAALSVEKLLHNGIQPGAGRVVVTGASGGVGSVAVALLVKLGFEVVAVTGKQGSVDWLKGVGAQQVLMRSELLPMAKKAVARPIYQAAVDTCGGDMISALLPQINYNGAVTTCGMVAGVNVSASVFPFILRGVDLLGVDSVEVPKTRKQALLNKVAVEWALNLEPLTTELGRAQLPSVLSSILQGQGQGRYLLNLFKE